MRLALSAPAAGCDDDVADDDAFTDEETDETKFSVRERDAWMFLVRTSRTSLKLTDTSASRPCSRTTTFLLCSPS